MVSSSSKILVIITSWPSKEHPYIIHLVAELKKKFPALQLFLFRRGDELNGKEILGEQQMNSILENALYRFQFTYNPFKYFFPLKNILSNCLISFNCYRTARQRGYSIRQSFGQLIYNNEILGKSYKVIYINALQTARHFCLKGVFPDNTILASSRGQDFDFDPTGYDEVLREIDFLHVLGAYLKDKALERGFNESRVFIIPPAVIPVKINIKEHDSRSHEIKIVTVSRFSWTKGLIYTLRAFAAVVKKLGGEYDLCLEILGDGEEKELIFNEVKRLDIDKNVIFSGWKNQNEVVEALFMSDIFLTLPISEGFNNSVLMAQAVGIPCIVSDAGGLPENVIHGSTGFVVKRYDYKETARVLEILIADKALRRKMGKDAKRRAISEFSLEKQVQAYINFIQTGLRHTKS